MRLFFDHCFTADSNFRFLKGLEKLGFRRDSEQVEHPGGMVCRFIMFPSSNREGRSYLEFIHTKPKGKPFKAAGVSFGCEGHLEKFHEAMKRSRKLQTTFSHRNYDWKIESQERRPGWNFVGFKKLGFRSLFPWITEYEPSPKRDRKRTLIHPNGVSGIDSLVFEVNTNGAKFFKALGKLPSRPRITLVPGKVTRLKQIVLEGRKLPKGDESLTFEGRPAVLLRNPTPGMWDLVLVRK